MPVRVGLVLLSWFCAGTRSRITEDLRADQAAVVSDGVCRYGNRLECCWGWTILDWGRCQPLCQQGCKHGECVGPDRCKCYPGYAGKACNHDLNECGLKPRPCKHRCMNTPGSYKCYCQDGYTLQPDGSCRNTRTCYHANCQYGCEVTKGVVRCTCPSPGLRLGPDRRTCVDVDECAGGGGVCPRRRKCVNTFGSFLCRCHLGFRLTYMDGRYTCADKDRRSFCTLNPDAPKCHCEGGACRAVPKVALEPQMPRTTRTTTPITTTTTTMISTTSSFATTTVTMTTAPFATSTPAAPPPPPPTTTSTTPAVTTTSPLTTTPSPTTTHTTSTTTTVTATTPPITTPVLTTTHLTTTITSTVTTTLPSTTPVPTSTHPTSTTSSAPPTTTLSTSTATTTSSPTSTCSTTTTSLAPPPSTPAANTPVTIATTTPTITTVAVTMMMRTSTPSPGTSAPLATVAMATTTVNNRINKQVTHKQRGDVHIPRQSNHNQVWEFDIELGATAEEAGDDPDTLVRHCSFDRGLCDWISERDGDLPWEVTRGAKGERYLSVPELKAGQRSVRGARLSVQSAAPWNRGDACFSFSHWLTGHHVGVLQLFVRKKGRDQRYSPALWSRTGGHGWRHTEVTLAAHTLDTVLLKVERRKGHRGPIAVDDVAVRQGACR